MISSPGRCSECQLADTLRTVYFPSCTSLVFSSHPTSYACHPKGHLSLAEKENRHQVKQACARASGVQWVGAESTDHPRTAAALVQDLLCAWPCAGQWDLQLPSYWQASQCPEVFASYSIP